MPDFARLYSYTEPMTQTQLRVHVHSRGFVQLTIEGRETMAIRMRDGDLDDLIRALKIARENASGEPTDG